MSGKPHSEQIFSWSDWICEKTHMHALRHLHKHKHVRVHTDVHTNPQTHTQ